MHVDIPLACCWCCFLSRCLLTLCILLRVQRLGRHKLLSNAIDTIVSGASIVIFLATMIEISSSGSLRHRIGRQIIQLVFALSSVLWCAVSTPITTMPARPPVRGAWCRW